MGFDKIKKKVVLSIDNPSFSQSVEIKQGYIGTLELVISFINNNGIYELPVGTTAKLRMLKPDRTHVLNDYQATGNEIIVEITQQMQAASGHGSFEVILENNGQTIATSTCNIAIKSSVHNDSNIQSSDEYISVIEALSRVEAASNKINTAIEYADDVMQAVNQLEQISSAAENTRVSNENARIAKDAIRPVMLRMTQAQYDALPQAEKDDPYKIYEITDDDDVLPNQLQNLITATESVLINRAGINDNTPTLSEAFSGKKVQTKFDNIDSQLAQKVAQTDYLTEINNRQIGDTNLQTQINNLVINGTGDSNPEVIQLRSDIIGSSYPTSKARLDNVESILRNGLGKLNFYGMLESGSLTTNGDNATSSNRYRRTLGYITIPSNISKITVRANTGYHCGIWWFDSNYAYVGKMTWVNTGTDYALSNIYPYYKIVVYHDTDDITDDLFHAGITFSYEFYAKQPANPDVVALQSGGKNYNANMFGSFIDSTSSVSSVIKNVQLKNYNKADKYAVGLIRKRYNSATNGIIGVYATDANGSTLASNNIMYITEINPVGEKTYFTRSGNKTITLTINWDSVSDGSQTYYNYATGGISANCYLFGSDLIFSNNIKTDIPIISLIDDDGYTDFSRLKAILDARGLKCSIASVTSAIGTSNHLTLAELQTLKSSGYDILSHSYSHAETVFKGSSYNLTNVTDEAILAEFKQSYDYLKVNGLETETIVYPWGYFDTYYGGQKIRYTELAKKAGYQFGVNAGYNTVMSEDVLDNMYYDRLFVVDSNGLDYYKTRINDCISKKGWIILGTHSAQANLTDAFFASVIDYILSTGVAFMTFKDANEIKRNIVSVGTFGYKTGSFYVGRNGIIKNN